MDYPEFLKVVRGKGLLIGLEFSDRFIGYRVAAGLFKRGVLVAGTLLSARTIRNPIGAWTFCKSCSETPSPASFLNTDVTRLRLPIIPMYVAFEPMTFFRQTSSYWCPRVTITTAVLAVMLSLSVALS